MLCKKLTNQLNPSFAKGLLKPEEEQMSDHKLKVFRLLASYFLSEKIIL